MFLHRAHLHSYNILQHYSISMTTRSASIHNAITFLFHYFAYTFGSIFPVFIAVTFLHSAFAFLLCLLFDPISSSFPKSTFYYRIPFTFCFTSINDKKNVTDRLNLFFSYSLWLLFTLSTQAGPVSFCHDPSTLENFRFSPLILLLLAFLPLTSSNVFVTVIKSLSLQLLPS
jgi:hypothetical protein